MSDKRKGVTISPQTAIEYKKNLFKPFLKEYKKRKGTSIKENCIAANDNPKHTPAFTSSSFCKKNMDNIKKAIPMLVLTPAQAVHPIVNGRKR